MKGFKEFIFTDDCRIKKILYPPAVREFCLWEILTLIDISFSANYH